MKRIDEFGAEIDKYGVGKNGFTGGVPGVTPATVLGADWCNNVQEEISRGVEWASALDSNQLGQLELAMRVPVELAAMNSYAPVTQGSDFWRAVTSDGRGKLFLCGNNGAFGFMNLSGTSVDTVTLTLSPSSTQNFRTACTAGSHRIVIAGGTDIYGYDPAGGGVARVVNASGWLMMAAGYDSAHDIACVTAWDGTSSYRTYTATAGLAFSSHTQLSAVGLETSYLPYGASVLLAAAAAAPKTSSDGGVTWAAHSWAGSGFDSVFAADYHARHGFVVIGAKGTATIVQTSPDGTTWTQVLSIASSTPGGLLLTGAAIYAITSAAIGGSADCTLCYIVRDGRQTMAPFHMREGALNPGMRILQPVAGSAMRTMSGPSQFSGGKVLIGPLFYSS